MYRAESSKFKAEAYIIVIVNELDIFTVYKVKVRLCDIV